MSRTVSVVALLFVAITACAAPPVQQTPPDARFGAPPVTAPRDVSQRSNDPCEALAAADLAELRLSPSGSLKTLQTGDRACDWRSSEGGRYLTIIVVADRDVLVDTYRTRQFPIFEPIRIGDLPAVREQSYAGSTTCTVTVGTASGQGFVADFSGGGAGLRACEEAERAAGLVTVALPPLPAK